MKEFKPRNPTLHRIAAHYNQNTDWVRNQKTWHGAPVHDFDAFVAWRNDFELRKFLSGINKIIAGHREKRTPSDIGKLGAAARWNNSRTQMPPCVRCLHGLGFGAKRICKLTFVKPKVARRWLYELGPAPFDRVAIGRNLSGRHKAQQAAAKRLQPKPTAQYSRPIGPKRPPTKEELEEKKATERERSRLYQLHKYKTDPQHMLRGRLRRRLRKMIGERKAYRSTQDMIGCDWPQFEQHIASQFTARMSWGNYGKWHIDHIRPCSSFDLTNDDEVRRCFHFSNLRPLWAKDNLAKSDKIVPFQPQLFHLFSLSDKSERVATATIAGAAGEGERYEESITP